MFAGFMYGLYPRGLHQESDLLGEADVSFYLDIALGLKFIKLAIERFLY